MRRISDWFFWILTVSSLATAPSFAEALDQSVALTVYNNDLALIEHQRLISAPKGQSRIEFKGVSAQIIPETVAFTSKSMSVIEQNFDYDLLTPDKLMEKAVGGKVRIVRTNPGSGEETTEEAEVLAANGGVVLKIGNRIEVLRDDNLPTRVIFDKVPENLRASPTLSLLVDAEKTANEIVKLSYLSHGLSWAADYVAVFDEKAGKTSVQGWITLKNQSGTSFENAATQLVAGKVNFSGDLNEYNQRESYMTRTNYGESTSRTQLADYYIYPLKDRTTIANKQTKQIGFLSAAEVKASKGYEYRSNWFVSQNEPQHADVRVRFANRQAEGLGDQLPAGMVRVYIRDGQGQPQFVGEDSIGHTPSGSELALKIGEAFDVTVQPTLVERISVSKREDKYRMYYLVRNGRNDPVTVTIRQDGLRYNGKIEAENIKSRRVDASSVAWDVPVPAHSETILTFTARFLWW